MGKQKNSEIYQSNSYYHIYNRGNNKARIFHQDKDFEEFKKLMYRYLKKTHIMLIAYCYMPNHYHFILKCGKEWKEISKFMHSFMTSYALYFNRKYQKVGRVFQGPFQIRRIAGKKDLYSTIEYVKNNPNEILEQNSQVKWKKNEYPWVFVKKVNDY